MIRYTIILCMALISASLLRGQSRVVSTISTAGGTYNTADISYFWTMGDLVIDDLRPSESSMGASLGFLAWYAAIDSTGGLSTSTYDIGPEELLDLTLSPIPANSFLELRIDEEQLELSTKYEVTDALGRTLLQGKVHPRKTRIDIHFLPAGQYHIRLVNAKTIVAVQSFIKS